MEAKPMKQPLSLLAALTLAPLSSLTAAVKHPEPIASLIEQNCLECHDSDTRKGKLDLTALSFDLSDPTQMERWVQVFDRVEKMRCHPSRRA